MAGRVGKFPQTGRGSYVNLRPLRWAEDICCLQLGPRSLLQLLARRSDEFGCCSYRQEVLARELGCSKRSVSNDLRILRHFGLVRLIGRQTDFQRISSVYHLVGWGERKAIPISGHPVFGRYVKEPGGRDRLEIERAQILLRDAERIAAHNKDSELNTTSAEEEILELCIRALGNWPGDADLERLRCDHLTLIDLVGEGYSPEADILPVLRRKAASRYRPRAIRSWRYFEDAIAEYAGSRRRAAVELPEAAQAPQPVPSGPTTADLATAETRRALQRALEELARQRGALEGGPAC
ncbi:hypothetical protein [Paracoccus sp. SCSIO 75233]|uniref:hypothetical protein n=1 Tax=Paracoccus sp. SCSIO 75233 TaxID=3017782 RepID=UPI0022EFE1ED|nr:hypothetical protein [Paracoccus sp. SCSIO 75233]WBU53987.1 hypothetical protein PAF12_03880 [Paracoccus sp. SCSIO 75233]